MYEYNQSIIDCIFARALSKTENVLVRARHYDVDVA